MMIKNILMKLVRSKNVIVVLGLLLLFFLIFRGGRYLRLPLNTRLLIVVIVLFIGILYLLIKSMQARRGADKLERSIKSQADDQKMGMRPEKREEIDALKLELTKAIDALKQSKLGRGRSGRSALYALPWYMFIGPPAAGKTTAIINSGLEFPYQSEIKGVGGTRNCDWFFSKSAILLDTAGRYTTEEEDRPEWHAFLEMLKKYRRRRPINGVLVGVSITDIADANLEDIEWHAKNIRQRIDELVERLGSRFPVYLVFTKCDLLQGFVQLFENLSRKERQQIWGATFSQEQMGADPRELFNQEFQVLLRALYDFRMKRLSVPTKSEDRGRLFVFPLEFASIKERVGHFIANLFQLNPYQENPFFRGVYFTSGTQEGVPLDLVIQAVAKQFNLPAGIIGEPEVEKKSYFIKELFTDVIVPDLNMVTQTSGAATRKNLLRFGTVAVSAVLLGLFILWIFQGFVRSRISLNAVKSSAALMEEFEWQADVPSLMANFHGLDRFREQIVQLEAYESDPPFFRTGMHRGGRVLPHARELYYDRFGFFANNFLFTTLAQKLTEYGRGAVFPPGKIMAYLTSYLLMSSENPRLIEDADYQDFLTQQLLALLDEVLSPRVAETQYLELRPLMERQIGFFVAQIGREGMPAFSSDNRLVTQVRRAISTREKENLGTVYESLKLNEQARQLSFVSLAQILEKPNDELLNSPVQIPGIFTQNGYEEYFREAVYEHVKRISEDDWVMGETREGAAAEAIDTEAVVQELKRLYFGEYQELWWQLLRDVRYSPFEDLSSASAVLNRLGDPEDSPLITVLNLTAQQTRLQSLSPEKKGILKKGSEKLSDLFREDSKATAADIGFMEDLSEAFTDVHALCAAPGEELPENMTAILNLYITVGSVLESMSDDPETKARDYAVQVLQDTGELPDAISSIRQALSDLDPEARRALFEQPLINAWTAVLAQAKEKLNRSWKAKVFDEFQTSLADKYPFQPEGRDAAMADVEGFFKPSDGVLDTFISEELTPFFDTDDWTPKTWEDHGMQFSAETLEALRKAGDLKKNFFERGFPIFFRMRPDSPDSYEVVTGTAPYILTIVLNVDGQDQTYEMGHANYQEFSWPSAEGQRGASLQIVMKEKELEPPPLQFSGVWGLFRLLHEAEIESEGTTSSDFKLSWIFSMRGRYQIRVKYLLAAGSVANPFRDFKSFFSFRCPETLNGRPED